MTAREFAYWLQGFFELRGADPDAAEKPLTAEQTELVRRHLSLVFAHEIDGSYGDAKHTAKLNATHAAPVGPDKTLIRC